MFTTLLQWLALAALCAVGAAAIAQAPPAAPRPADPLDANARVPAVFYQSAFARYRRAGDDTAIPWRDANDTVARIGGWRTYAREAQQAEPAVAAPLPAPAPASAPDTKAAPMPAGHGGHKMP